MRRIILLVTVAAVMAVMMALSVEACSTPVTNTLELI
jgi:hypothetical protein